MTTDTCDGCGEAPCACEAIQEAYYAVYPEEAPAACDRCSTWYDGLSLRDGLCERCWSGDRDQDEEEEEDYYAETIVSAPRVAGGGRAVVRGL